MLSPTLLALLLAVFLLAMLPTRRLYLAGWSGGALASYLVVLMAFGLLLADLRGPTRYLVPVAVVLYVAPFTPVPAAIRRWQVAWAARHGAAAAPMKNVTPPEVTVRDATRRLEPGPHSARPRDPRT